MKRAHRIIPKINRIVQPRIRGISGPVAQRVAPRVIIHTPGNFIQPKT